MEIMVFVLNSANCHMDILLFLVFDSSGLTSFLLLPDIPFLIFSFRLPFTFFHLLHFVQLLQHHFHQLLDFLFYPQITHFHILGAHCHCLRRIRKTIPSAQSPHGHSATLDGAASVAFSTPDYPPPIPQIILKTTLQSWKPVSHNPSSPTWRPKHPNWWCSKTADAAVFEQKFQTISQHYPRSPSDTVHSQKSSPGPRLIPFSPTQSAESRTSILSFVIFYNISWMTMIYFPFILRVFSECLQHYKLTNTRTAKRFVDIKK